MGKTVLQLKGVTKVYKLYCNPLDRLKESLHPMRKKYHKDFYALKGIDLEVQKGEIVGIIGKNGSGKSTLLKIITGVLSQTRGSIRVNGKISALLELGAGFNPEFTGMENIYLNGAIMGYTKDEVDQKIDNILGFAEIGEFIYQKVKTYSSGMFARLAFAVAINVDPDILIVDEALAVGDNRFQAKCYRKIEGFVKQGKSVIMVTHDVEVVRKFCDKVLWMDNGSVYAVGDVFDITSKYVEYMNTDSEAQSSNQFLDEEINTFDTNLISNPLNRWGKLPGIIKSTNIITKGKDKAISKIFSINEKVYVNVYADLSYIEDLRYVSIAFSFKSIEGIDLVVNTTYDNNIRINKRGLIKAEFEMKMNLVPGDYILVVAVEDRYNNVTEYYDYVEGAEMFKVVSDKPNSDFRYYGLVYIPATISIS